VTIAARAALSAQVAAIIKFEGCIEFDAAKPDDAPRELMDLARLALFDSRAATGECQGLVQACWDLVDVEARRRSSICAARAPQ
jgi:hypothetical protein